MRLSDHERSTDTVTLSAEQFAKLVELLTPGYELSKRYLAQIDTPTGLGGISGTVQPKD
jgi:hypothetical protein